MLVVVLKHNLLDYTEKRLIELLGKEHFNILYINNNDNRSLYWHMTAASLKLQEFLIRNASLSIDMINTPVLVIFEQFESDLSIVCNRTNTDEVFFDSLHCNKSPSLMYGSIVAISKVLKSSIKFENFLKDDKNTTVKMPFKSPTIDLFQLIWYTQRTGLKIYEYVS